MMILLTGGSGCGKSSFAEKLLLRLPAPRYYLAAMRPYSEEILQKIGLHQEERAAAGIQTFDRYTDLTGLVLPERGTALLECVCNLTSNEMFDEDRNVHDPSTAVISGVESLEKQCGTLIVVTNEVGGDKSEDYDEATKAYIRVLGAVNAALAERADTVCEIVCGIPVMLKGMLP
ncbi:MAG TPA: bifunctional adenosylcobinamide kinase/adenosylcobinamide-phosphate guanylyltransferase [Oscillospiraceae bacterium]|nr:bifunctional adenosylcobinamide kinase/adenosylcobinamide-phosphate guanylyltransferase [Oscillospiraceae bacterium]HXK77979.1 bifunctional adenosylcobinamide kinase/adenosylcobinamide-phosphate guanylyltransferase [Oscillospiraceae bacterium]